MRHVCVPATQCTALIERETALPAGNAAGGHLYIFIAPDSSDHNPIKRVDYKIWQLTQERVYKTPVRDTSQLQQRLIDTLVSHKLSQGIIDDNIVQ